MIDRITFTQLALSFPGAVEQHHFEKISFRAKNKIFATLSADGCIACVKLSRLDQVAFCSLDKKIIYPVENKWGTYGWTYVDLKKVNKELLTEILATSYDQVVKK